MRLPHVGALDVCAELIIWLGPKPSISFSAYSLAQPHVNRWSKKASNAFCEHIHIHKNQPQRPPLQDSDQIQRIRLQIFNVYWCLCDQKSIWRHQYLPPIDWSTLDKSVLFSATGSFHLFSCLFHSDSANFFVSSPSIELGGESISRWWA